MGVKTWEQYLEHEVPHHIRAWNKGTPARVSVYGIIHLELYCGYVFMCTAARRRKWAAAAAQTLPVQPLVSKVLDIKYCSKEAVAHPTGKAM